MKIYKIYSIDDSNGNPVYVGRTTYDLKNRLSSHKCKNSKIANWLKNNKHSINLICDTKNKKDEEFYINLFTFYGFELFNISSTNKSSLFYKRYSKPRSKMILDKLNGIYYNSSRELERILCLPDGSIRRKLNGNRKNNTNYIYV